MQKWKQTKKTFPDIRKAIKKKVKYIKNRETHPIYFIIFSIV